MPLSAPVSRPIAIVLPPQGAYFAESVHDSPFEMGWRQDPFHKLIYVSQGEAVEELDRPVRQVSLPRGTLVLIPAGTRHRLRDRRPSILLLLCLSDAFVRMDEDVAGLWRRLLQADDHVFHLGAWWPRRMENLFRRALFEQVAQPFGSTLFIRLAAIDLLVQLARLPQQRRTGSASERVELVRRELESSFFDDWSVDRAAAAAGMSRRSFSDYFRRQTGRTFLAQLTELRLQHSASLLAQGNHSIVGAALAAGYRDVSHFYRLFRQRFGTTPKAWAERQR